MDMIKGKRWFFFPVVAIGVISLIIVVSMQRHPPLLPQSEIRKVVEVIELKPSRTKIQVNAFGRVNPKVQWQLLPEVGGKVMYKNPDFAPGKILAKGTLLLSIDPLDYQIRLTQAKADSAAIEGQIKGKQLQKSNLTVSLQIENNRFDLVKSNFSRKQTLREQGLISQSELDTEKLNLLQQQQKIQELQNQLNLIPDDINVLQAQHRQALGREAEAQSQLEKTHIYLPFEGRVSEVNFESEQVVSPQQLLAKINGIEVMEVEAQLSLSDMLLLMQSTQFASNPTGKIPQADQLGLTGEISLTSMHNSFTWPAKITRIGETVDQSLATVSVVLQVSQAYRELNIGKRPPLVHGMFVSARIKGGEKPYWLVPERALHGDKLYLLDSQQKLQILSVEVLFRQQGQVAVKGPLNNKMQLVLTDIIPAVAGMALKPSALKVPSPSSALPEAK